MHWLRALIPRGRGNFWCSSKLFDNFVYVVTRFVCKDTVEEKILALQKRKTALASNVLTGYDYDAYMSVFILLVVTEWWVLAWLSA